MNQYLLKSIKSIVKKIKKSIYSRKVMNTAKQVGKDLSVNGKSIVTKKTILGDNVNFNGMKISGGGSVVIGNNFHSGSECLMITQIHNYDNGTEIPYDNTYIEKSIEIKDNVWLGARVLILGGVTIGEGAIIQAGSVIVSDIPDYAIAGGHPAKVFKYRNIEHYNQLKKQNMFH